MGGEDGAVKHQVLHFQQLVELEVVPPVQPQVVLVNEGVEYEHIVVGQVGQWVDQALLFVQPRQQGHGRGAKNVRVGQEHTPVLAEDQVVVARPCAAVWS